MFRKKAIRQTLEDLGMFPENNEKFVRFTIRSPPPAVSVQCDSILGIK